MSGNAFDVVVHFSEPVPGIHPIDGGPFRADRHVFKAHHLWQDAADTRLITADDITVAQWPTDLVDRVVWKSLTVAATPAESPPGRAVAAPTVDTNTATTSTVTTTAGDTATTTAAPTSITEVVRISAADDAGDWIQPMTLITSDIPLVVSVGASSNGSPHPTAS